MSRSCCPTGTSRTALALAAGRPAGAGATPLTETDWAALLEPVARELLGDPVRRPASGEWRYRRKGSLAVHVAGPRRGTWRDHEADVGGGVLELLAHVEGLTRPEALEWLRHRGLLDGPRTDAGRGASRFSGRAAATDTGRSRKTALRASQGRVKPPIRPQSGMFALIGPSRCGSGPSRSQRPQTIRRADGWPGGVCGGLASHCRRPSAGWQRLAPRLAQSWRPLLHRARADCPASSSSTSTPTGSQPSTSPAPTVCRASVHFVRLGRILGQRRLDSLLLAAERLECRPS